MTVLARLIGLAALVTPPAALGLQPLVTDDAGTQGTGGNQIEAVYQRSVEKEPGTADVTGTASITYTRGLTDVLDAYAGASRVRFRTHPAGPSGTGAGNVAAGMKWRLFNDPRRQTSIAFNPEVLLPVSPDDEARGLGSARTNASGALLVSRETGFGALHVNLALASYRFGLAQNRAVHRPMLGRLSVAPVVELTDTWQLALDAGLVTNPHRAEKPAMGYAGLGLIYLPGKDLELAAGIARDVRHRGHSVRTATAALTWRFR